MPDLVMQGFLDLNVAQRPRDVPAFRTLLAGNAAAYGCRGRRWLEEMLATRSGPRAHRVLQGCRDGCQIEQAEGLLRRDAVDIVVLDLDGSIEAVLSLVERLRAAAGEGVVFVGILARHATAASRLYLSAVVDEVVDAPSRAAHLHRAIADALEGAADFPDSLAAGSMAASNELRH